MEPTTNPIKLDAKPGAPVLDAGAVHDHLEAAGIAIGDAGVTTHSDGGVSIDAPDSKQLQAAWSAFDPGAAVAVASERAAALDRLVTAEVAREEAAAVTSPVKR